MSQSGPAVDTTTDGAETSPRTYPHGATCWVDTEQPDPDAAARFYRGLFGWELTEAATAGVPGSLRVASLGGRDVTAIAPTDAATAGWNTYVAVGDLDSAAQAVREHGGRVVGAADAGVAGRAASCVDPSGAPFRLWQAGHRPGAQYVNDPGGWVFSHLLVGDRTAAESFYGALWGWSFVDLPDGSGTMVHLPGYGEHLAATSDPGILERQAFAPPGFADVTAGFALVGPDATPRWQVAFGVADRDDSVATAEQLGGTVVSASDDRWTRQAVLRDPQGAEFAISQFAPPDDWQAG